MIKNDEMIDAVSSNIQKRDRSHKNSTIIVVASFHWSMFTYGVSAWKYNEERALVNMVDTYRK